MRLLPIPWSLLIVALIVASVVGGTYYLWEMQGRRRVQRARDAKLAAGPEPGAIALRDAVPGSSAAGRPPQFFGVAIGTMGIWRLLATLHLLYVNGNEHEFGGAVVVEHDAAMREHFKRQLPPAFRDDRIVYADNPDYNGFANRPIDWALDHIDEWGVEIQRATSEACETYLRRSGNRAPMVIVTFLSLGGQAPTAIPVHAILADRFGAGDSTLHVCATALPQHSRLRERWLYLKPVLDRLSAVAWLLVDNLESDVTTADNALVLLLVGHLAAATTADRPTALNNMLALAATKQPGAVLVFETVTARVSAFAFQPDPARPPTYYVQHRPLIVEVQRTLRKLANGHGSWSATLPVPERGTATFDLVILPLIPSALHQIHDDVMAGRTLRQHLGSLSGHRRGTSTGSGANHELTFASLAREIDPVRPVCQVIGIRLQAVRDGARLVAEIIKAPSLRRLAAASPQLKIGKALPAEYVPEPDEVLS